MQAAKSRIFKAVSLYIFFSFLGPDHAFAAQWGDKGYPIYQIDMSAASQSLGPIQCKAAHNENILLVFNIAGVTPDELSVEVHGQTSPMEIEYYVSQVRPIPADLSQQFYWDGLVPYGSPLMVSVKPLLVAIDFKVLSTHGSGHSQYSIIFKSNSHQISQTLNLLVYKFALPDDLPITVMGVFWPNPEWFRPYCSPSQELDSIYHAYEASLRSYKFNATNLFALPAEEIANGRNILDYPKFVSQLDSFLNLGYRSFRIPPLSASRHRDSIDAYLKSSSRYFSIMHSYLNSRGLADRAMVKVWDEPSMADIPKVYDVYKYIKHLAPSFKTESAGGPPDLSLANVIDIWAVYGKKYNASRVSAACSKGQKVWLYANYLHSAARPPVSQRLIGWYLSACDFSGYLAWGVNVWRLNPWSHSPAAADHFRRGVFYYPHPSTGLPLPNLRLQSLRRGFIDYQYLALLKEKAVQQHIDPAAYSRIQASLSMIGATLRSGGPDVTWQQLDDLRDQIAQLLDQSIVSAP